MARVELDKTDEKEESGFKYLTNFLKNETMDILESQFQPFLRLKSESGSENVYYSVLYEGLPKEFRLLAGKELKETDEKKERGLEYLLKILENENVNFDHNILLLVLRCCKYDLKKSEAKLKSFIDKRRAFIEELMNLDIKKAEKIIDDMPIGVLPYRDEHGRLVMYSCPNSGDLDSYDIKDVALCAVALVLFLLKFPITSITGFSYFAECKAPSLWILYQIFKEFKPLIRTVLAFPVRIKRVEVLNEVPIIRWMYGILKHFVPSKIASRVSFHGSGYKSLHKNYNPNILPEIFGGNLNLQGSQLYKKQLLDFIGQLKAEGAENTCVDN